MGQGSTRRSAKVQDSTWEIQYVCHPVPRTLPQLLTLPPPLSPSSQHGRQSDIVLLDCSELELGRTLGRREDIDDTVAACRRRLELYRTVTLPAAKALDDAHRLLVVGGHRPLR